MTDKDQSLLSNIEPLTLEQLELDLTISASGMASDMISINSLGDTITLTSPWDYSNTMPGLNAAQATYNFNNTNNQTFANIPTISIQDSTTWSPVTGLYGPSLNNGITVQGNAEFAGDVKIKGKNILELIEKIEERLAILHPNTELESEWEELKSLGEQYRKLEAHIKEKMKVWDKLKAMPKIEI